MPNQDQAGMDTEGKRWTICNFSKRFTVEKATASPIPLGSKVEVAPVSELHQLQGELEAARKERDAEAAEANRLFEERNKALAAEQTVFASLRRALQSLAHYRSGVEGLVLNFRASARDADRRWYEREVDFEKQRARGEHCAYARTTHHLQALLDSEPNCTPSKEMLGDAIGNCSERPRIERTSELLHECADAVARSKGDSEWATACNVIAAIERVWDARSAQAERERRLPADQNPDQGGGDARGRHRSPEPPSDSRVAGAAVDVGGGLETSEWPDAVRLYKPPKSKRVRIAPSRPAPGFEKPLAERHDNKREGLK